MTCDDCPLKRACPRYRARNRACIVGRNAFASVWTAAMAVAAGASTLF